MPSRIRYGVSLSGSGSERENIVPVQNFTVQLHPPQSSLHSPVKNVKIKFIYIEKELRRLSMNLLEEIHASFPVKEVDLRQYAR